jgi:hypothetical protein
MTSDGSTTTKYDVEHLIYIGEQYETERKLSRWSLDGGLALAVLRDLQALRSNADEMRDALTVTRAIVSEAATEGFRWEAGDWAKRLFENQARISSALKDR